VVDAALLADVSDMTDRFFVALIQVMCQWQGEFPIDNKQPKIALELLTMGMILTIHVPPWIMMNSEIKSQCTDPPSQGYVGVDALKTS